MYLNCEGPDGPAHPWILQAGSACANVQADQGLLCLQITCIVGCWFSLEVLQ